MEFVQAHRLNIAREGFVDPETLIDRPPSTEEYMAALKDELLDKRIPLYNWHGWLMLNFAASGFFLTESMISSVMQNYRKYMEKNCHLSIIQLAQISGVPIEESNSVVENCSFNYGLPVRFERAWYQQVRADIKSNVNRKCFYESEVLGNKSNYQLINWEDRDYRSNGFKMAALVDDEYMDILNKIPTDKYLLLRRRVGRANSKIIPLLT